MLIALLVLAYLAVYIPDAMQIAPDMHLSLGLRAGSVHDIAYLQVMLLGGWLARDPRPLGRPRATVDSALVVVLLAYFAVKYVMVVRGQFAAYYGVLHLLVLVGCGLMFVSLTDERVIAFYRRVPLLPPAVTFVAGLTLEIYLVHSYLIGYGWLSGILFPLNIVTLVAFTLGAAWIVARVSRFARAAPSSLAARLGARRQFPLCKGREGGAVR